MGRRSRAGWECARTCCSQKINADRWRIQSETESNRNRGQSSQKSTEIRATHVSFPSAGRFPSQQALLLPISQPSHAELRAGEQNQARDICPEEQSHRNIERSVERFEIQMRQYRRIN